jgi:hypothetical protein
LALIVAVIPAALWAASPAGAVSGAAFTTTADGSKVNANHYADKCDVYINGGPNNGANTLTDGFYFFAVLNPSGQSDPNDGAPNLLSSDPRSNRVVQVAGGKIVGTTGGHTIVNDPSTDTILDDQLVQLCDYADTTNPGGVYILAMCLLPSEDSTAAAEPSDCKYDAFKVTASGGQPNSDLVATKDADPSFTRTYSWDVEKSVDKTQVSASGGTATFNYTVEATKSAGVDSSFVVSGEISVFNPNVGTVTDVAVTDAIDATVCTVSGGSTTIAGGDSASFGYSCALSGATPSTTGTNTAAVTWDKGSINSPSNTTPATAVFDFADATVTSVGNSAAVTDTYAGTLDAAATVSGTYNYSRTIAIPAHFCLSYDNTATVTFQGGTDSSSVTVRVCGPNDYGLTMGYWKNNSDKVITNANWAAYCSSLQQYPLVLTGLSCATKAALFSYIKTTLTAAEASGTGAPMYKGQFLATALSAKRTAALGSTNVQLTSSEATLLGFGSNTCKSVSDVLVAGNARYPILSNVALTSKDNFMKIKSVFDRINNNIQPTC